MTDNDKPGLEIELHNTIVKASCQILTAVQDVLRPTPMPGRHHYLFTLKDLTTCFQVRIQFKDLISKGLEGGLKGSDPTEQQRDEWN